MITFKRFLTEAKTPKHIEEFDPSKPNHVKAMNSHFSSPHYHVWKRNRHTGDYDFNPRGHQYLYHGTTRHRANQILKNGIKRGMNLTSSKFDAAGYGISAHEHDSDTKSAKHDHSPVVIRVHKKHVAKGKHGTTDGGNMNDIDYKEHKDSEHRLHHHMEVIPVKMRS